MSRSRGPIRLKPLPVAAAPQLLLLLPLLLLACHCQQLLAALPLSPPPTTNPRSTLTTAKMVAVATRPDKMAMYKVAPNVGPFDHKVVPNVGPFDHKVVPNVGPFDHKVVPNVGPFDHDMAPNVGPLDQKMAPKLGPSDPNITIIDDLDTTPVNTTKVSPNTKRQPIDLTVGYLTAIKGDVKDRQGLAVSGALTMALKEVNDSPDLLPDVRLVLRWNDTKGDTVQTTRAMTDMICDGVAAFFGPEASCYVEAIISHARNIPMISYKCSDPKASEVPTFARTDPPDTQVTKSLISLLKYYNWYKFSIITETDWKIVAKTLRKEALANKLTVNHFNEVLDRHACCVNGLTCCKNGYWYELIRETRNGTRIYVFFGSRRALIEMMGTMQVFGLFENGEYMVIYVDQNTYSVKDAVHYLWQPEQWSSITSKPGSCEDSRDFYNRARSLLVIVLSPPNEQYQEFTDHVRDFNQREPFNFTFPSIFLNVSYVKYVSIYAAYLYDSVKLYAKALDQLLREELKRDDVTQLNRTIIEQVAKNGTRIIQTIIKNKTYVSVTGATIRLDKNGDSEGNFTVIALKRYKLVEHNWSCDYHMMPVGGFELNDNNSYKLHVPSEGVEWASGEKPNDEPSCGFDNRLCAKDDSETRSMVTAIALGILLFCTSVVTLSIYRKWKIEQEIEGLLWKIQPQDINLCNFGKDMVAASKLSLAPSVNSYESRCGPQVFAETATYRGVMVRIKELKFSKKKDISRNIMKEMRQMRELRHDNINTFIGAVLEPMRVLIVTDYCAKGSLYDIVENEDIKLDKMFIASLVHDLIKGMLFIHSTPSIEVHGNLKSSNCVVTSRWVLQVTDFGLHELRQCAENDSIGEHQYYRNLLWKAPELLRDSNAPVRGTQEGDVYAFAIILYEIIGRKGPFGILDPNVGPKEIVEMVKMTLLSSEPFRPNLDDIRCTEHADEEVLNVIRECWAENPEDRPKFRIIRERLKNLKEGKKRNIMDQMMEMMEKHSNNLEELVQQRTMQLYEEKRKTEDLLHRMLPAPVAHKLTIGEGVEPESFDLVTIYFSDIVGFTSMSAESTPLEVVNFLNDLYTLFDRIIRGYEVYKVETIGDAYMVVSGLPIRNGDSHAGEIASMSLDLLEAVKKHKIAHRPNETLKLRIGIHTGPVVAGVVGLTMPRYCLFGDTVNTASRMESTGEPLRIHISAPCKAALDKLGGYEVDDRGFVPMKGKGNVHTYWLTGANDRAVARREVDLQDLRAFFCPSKRSPKLLGGPLGGGTDAASRRHSSAPRGNSVDRGVATDFPFHERGVSTDFPLPHLDSGVVTDLPRPLPLSPLVSHQNNFSSRRRIPDAHQSLDPFPNKHFEKSLCKRSCHSLQENSRDGVCENGSLVCAPLLNENKKWHSLELVVDQEPKKTLGGRSTIRSWIFGFLTPSIYRSSDSSLRKGGYTDLQQEKESIA